MSAATRLGMSSRDEVVGLLAPALGDATAAGVVDAAARSLGLVGDEWPSEKRRAVLEQVAAQPGLVGITARVVLHRFRPVPPAAPSAIAGASQPVGLAHPAGKAHPAAAHPAAAQPPADPGGPSIEAPASVRSGTKPWEVVCDLLAPALGADGARAAVERGVKALGLGRAITSAQALGLLEHVAREPGVVGIAARFAKTRLHLLSW